MKRNKKENRSDEKAMKKRNKEIIKEGCLRYFLCVVKLSLISLVVDVALCLFLDKNFLECLNIFWFSATLFIPSLSA